MQKDMENDPRNSLPDRNRQADLDAWSVIAAGEVPGALYEPGTAEQGSGYLEGPVPPEPRRRRVWLPVTLFVATCLSTLAAGVLFSSGWSHGWGPALCDGLKYSSAVMTILLCHEMGHFLQAWRYGVHASLPYFIPMPFSPIGTFGAVIAMEPRRGDRRAVFDIGISGPLAGLAPTFVFCVLGLSWSTPSAAKPDPNEPLLGSSYLFGEMVSHFVPANAGAEHIDLHPVAVAGWVGLLVTALNLFPIGQLDGGHILYGLLRRKAHLVATFVLMAAIVGALRFHLWHWWLMLFLLMFLGARHPPTADDDVPLGLARHLLGWLTLAFMPLAFTPIPIGFLGG
jgi:membrane-associated protease RseP (regulator of RpoE activity)